LTPPCCGTIVAGAALVVIPIFNTAAIFSQAFGRVTFANNFNLFNFLIYNLA
jgi:hypothetical protein